MVDVSDDAKVANAVHRHLCAYAPRQAWALLLLEQHALAVYSPPNSFFICH